MKLHALNLAPKQKHELFFIVYGASFLKNLIPVDFSFFICSQAWDVRKKSCHKGGEKEWVDHIAKLKKYFDANDLYLTREFLFMCLYCQKKILELEILFLKWRQVSSFFLLLLKVVMRLNIDLLSFLLCF